MADPGSPSLLDELFQAGDENVLDEVRRCQDEEKLGALARPWLDDRRPSLRRALLRYVDEGCAWPFHRALVKRLFKLAEDANDDEAMAHFMAAFDRFTNRKLGSRYRFELKSRRLVEETALVHSRDVPAFQPQTAQHRPRMAGLVFSRHTREYLKRRAFRYFRHLGLRDPPRFRAAMAIALPLYQDKDLQDPAQLLEAWSLCHVLFGRSPVLRRVPGGVRLAEDHKLTELEPAPMFEDVWWEGFDELLGIFERAGSRTVRSASLSLLRKHHADRLAGLPVARLRSSVVEVQSLGAELLESATGLDALPIGEWLELLKLESATVLPVICDLVRRHVAPDRLDLAQCVELACSGAAPAAQLGLAWAQSKQVGAADLPTLVRLGTSAKGGSFCDPHKTVSDAPEAARRLVGMMRAGSPGCGWGGPQVPARFQGLGRNSCCRASPGQRCPGEARPCWSTSRMPAGPMLISANRGSPRASRRVVPVWVSPDGTARSRFSREKGARLILRDVGRSGGRRSGLLSVLWRMIRNAS
ncbi:MAG: hypothetical protein HY901_25230 [Deltaproteobacteria bacterium]|nr:hypothetical protein [Deltaproteobacteria bacterium]